MNIFDDEGFILPSSSFLANFSNALVSPHFTTMHFFLHQNGHQFFTDAFFWWKCFIINFIFSLLTMNYFYSFSLITIMSSMQFATCRNYDSPENQATRIWLSVASLFGNQFSYCFLVYFFPLYHFNSIVIPF